MNIGVLHVPGNQYGIFHKHYIYSESELFRSEKTFKIMKFNY